jgi:hypothetical protein
MNAYPQPIHSLHRFFYTSTVDEIERITFRSIRLRVGKALHGAIYVRMAPERNNHRAPYIVNAVVSLKHLENS